MLSSRSLPVLLLPLFFLLVATKEMRYSFRPEEKEALVVMHNLYRSKVIPEAKYMLKMYWDEELAEFAEAYAQKCRWEHNPALGQRGENLYIIGTRELHLLDAVADWYNEHRFYNFRKKTCQQGKMCGHYTQIIWANTNKIGCGKYFCEKLQNINKVNMYLLVCNYLPRGNIRGQPPYREGPQCSQCPSVDRCVNGLCEPIRHPEEAQDLPSLVTEASSSLATVASGAKKKGVPSSLATETPSFLVTEIPASLATKAQPTLEIEAPSSLALKDPPSMATEAPSLLTSEVPSILASHSLSSLDEGLVTFPKSTHTPTPKLADKVASSARAPSVSPEKLLHSEISLIGIQDPFPHGEEKAKARGSHTLPPSGEVLASVFAAQDEPDELQATLVHMGHTSSRSLPSSPNTSATTNAMGRHTLALQSPLPDEVIPEDPDSDLGIEPVIEPEIGSDIPSGMEKPNNGMPSNVKPTMEKPTMIQPTTVKTTTVKPTAVKTTTVRMTTITTTMEKTTTVKPTTVKPTMVKTTTEETTSEEATTEEMTFEEPTVEKTTTETMTMEKMTRVKLNNLKANKVKPTKVKPSMVKPRKPNSAPDHVRSPFLGLLLLPPLVLAGSF